MSIENQKLGEINPIEKIISEIREIIKREGPHLATFVGDASLTYTPSLTAETFMFYPEESKVEIPVKWFLDRNYSPKEIRWALYHELAHFIDMRKNPEAYLNNFEYMQTGEANKKICSLLESKLRKDKIDQKKIDDLTKQKKRRNTDKMMSNLQIMAYKYLHKLYNILDDISVNNLVMQRAPFYSSEEGRKITESVYKKIGYGDPDFRKKPKHMQFVYSLIRDEMLLGPDKSIVDDDVFEIINERKIYGKTIKQFIDTKLKPKSGNLLDPRERYEHIRLIFLPLYLELLEKDIENVDFKKLEEEAKEQGEQGEAKEQGEQQTNGGFDYNPFKKDYDDSQNPSDVFSPEEIEKILEKFLKDKEESELSPEKRIEKKKKELKEEFDRKYDISPETREKFEGASASILAERERMRNFWKELIGKSVELTRKRVRGQKRGNVNVEDFIEKFPEISEGNIYNLLIYEKFLSKMENVNKPERIEISLVVDMSSSMTADNSKMQSLISAVALLVLSIRDFNEYLDQERIITKTKLSAFSEVYIFGSTFERIKKFSYELDNALKGHKEERAEDIRLFSHFEESLGSTNDAAVLADIVNSVDERKVLEIKKGKIMKIVFEITDGLPDGNVIESTKARIEDMIEKGIIPIAFQIGAVSPEERETFESIWNDEKRDFQTGIFVGENFDELTDKMKNVLMQLMRFIKL